MTNIAHLIPILVVICSNRFGPATIKAVAAASARRHDVQRNRISGLVEMVRPGGSLQERVVTGAHFIGRHDGFVDRIYEQLGLDPRRLYLIDPDRV